MKQLFSSNAMYTTYSSPLDFIYSPRHINSIFDDPKYAGFLEMIAQEVNFEIIPLMIKDFNKGSEDVEHDDESLDTW